MIGLILIILIVLAFFCVRIVAQTDCYIIEFLGSYKTTWENGIHFLIPGVERIARKVSMKEQVKDFPPQPVITKDNVTMQIDTVVYYNIFNPRAYAYGVENPVMALANLSATTLRNIIGDMELDQTLTSRDVINAKMQQVLDEATDSWGIKVNRVELKNIIPPEEIQSAMEKQMKAEREKREELLKAEAHKMSAITKAEGHKQAMILKAEAERDAAIAKATGEAESLRLVYEAQAEGMQKISDIKMSDSAIVLKKLEALEKLGDGRATKLVVPTDLSGIASNLSFIGETLNISKDIDLSEKKIEKKKPVDPCDTEDKMAEEESQEDIWEDLCTDTDTDSDSDEQN